MDYSIHALLLRFYFASSQKLFQLVESHELHLAGRRYTIEHHNFVIARVLKPFLAVHHESNSVFRHKTDPRAHAEKL